MKDIKNRINKRDIMIKKHLWRAEMGRTLSVSIDDEIDLPPGYHLEEARVSDGSMKVYLMHGKREVESWSITEDSPNGNEILGRAYENLES